MDVDVAQPSRDSPYNSFFDAANFPWQEPWPEQIRLRRASMHDSLIFDILLLSGGITQPHVLYPPENPEGLNKLLEAIADSTYDTLKQDSLVYYLLKWYQDGRERTFQQTKCIPPQFSALTDAYWHIDTGVNVARAVAILSDARLNRDYADRIILALSLAPDAPTLIRRYVQTAKPILVNPPELEMYTIALADSSVLEAWKFSRTFTDVEEMRSRLFRKILEWSLTPKPRPVALRQLLVLPYTPEEEEILNDFVQRPSTISYSSVALLQDLICVRLIQAGRYFDAVKLDRKFTNATPRKHLEITRSRSKMVQEVYQALPSIERSILDLELDPTIPQKAPLTPKPVVQTPRARQTEALDQSISQSWEEIRVPDALLNKQTPLKEVGSGAATARFGPASLQASTSTPAKVPLPAFTPLASGSSSVPRKNPIFGSSVTSAAKPRSSLGSSNVLNFNSSAIASPASGMKLPPPNLSSSHAAPHKFVPASQQKNAFYQPPPPKTNGVKRSFPEELNHSPEPHEPLDLDMETDNEGKVEKDLPNGKQNGAAHDHDADEGNALQYSVFSNQKQAPIAAQPPPAKISSKMKSPPPGSLMSDDDAMDEDQEEEPKPTSRSSRTTRKSVATSSKSQPVQKPPAKKARQSKKPVSRSIPGGLMDEDDIGGDEDGEEEDQVAPLRVPSPPPATTSAPRRGVRKSRSAASVDTTDEMEGIQTRRRSSRLTTTGSVNGGSPEQPAAKARKSTKTGGTRKKR
ncbi:hypothetical protein CVT24_012011 [Panaeolus cyanescens]|uniref:ELYS-like domain-containing protein n=1 Tax=Panaeolus cyanescens TaxID=181874 RepID=A0A409YNC8_9AGAR|nr:hypothetical protein CVT24_012011 [Panaeolus cyanescens]